MYKGRGRGRQDFRRSFAFKVLVILLKKKLVYLLKLKPINKITNYIIYMNIYKVYFDILKMYKTIIQAFMFSFKIALKNN